MHDIPIHITLFHLNHFSMRTFLFTCLLAVLSFTATAQVDAKLNVGSLIFGGIGIAGYQALSEKSSVSAGLGYASTKFGSDVYRYSNFRIIPEYRYYLNPRNGADRFFVGGYGKLTFLTGKEIDNSGGEDFSATRGALGILFGNKWVSNGGFVFELNLGLGRATVFGADNDSEAALSAITALDLCLGIIAGYRFGN